MKLEIPENLFDLTPEQEATVKMIYNNKVIKCLVAPYHSYAQLEKVVPYTPNTFLFPEREMNVNQCKQLVAILVASPKIEEAYIITKNQNIILDMVGDAVRVLTERDEIIYTGTKTFMANIHDIRYELLENKDHQLSTSEKEHAHAEIQTLIDKVQPGVAPISKAEADSLLAKIKVIGEPIIGRKLEEMFYSNVKIK